MMECKISGDRSMGGKMSRDKTRRDEMREDNLVGDKMNEGNAKGTTHGRQDDGCQQIKGDMGNTWKAAGDPTRAGRQMIRN